VFEWQWLSSSGSQAGFILSCEYRCTSDLLLPGNPGKLQRGVVWRRVLQGTAAGLWTYLSSFTASSHCARGFSCTHTRHIDTNTHIRTYTRAHARTHAHTRIHTHIYNTHTYIHTPQHTHTHTHTHARAHAHTYTHTHVHTHTKAEVVYCGAASFVLTECLMHVCERVRVYIGVRGCR